MSFLLYNDTIFSLNKEAKAVSLKNRVPSYSELNSDKVFLQDDYAALKNEIFDLLNSQDDSEQFIILGTVYYKLPGFVNFLMDKLNNVKIISLFEIAVYNNQNANNQQDFIEIYDGYYIATKYEISNNELTVFNQTIEQFDLLENLTKNTIGSYSNQTTEDKRRDLFKYNNLLNLNNYLNEIKDFIEKDKINERLYAINFVNIDGFNKIIKDKDFTVQKYIETIAYEFKQLTLEEHKAIIFSEILLIDNISKAFENNTFKTIRLSDVKVAAKPGLNYKMSQFSFVNEFFPDEDFTDEYFTRIIAEIQDKLQISFRKNPQNQSIDKTIIIEENHFSDYIFDINKTQAIKFDLLAKQDLFNNLHIGIINLDNKKYFKLIRF
jgi:hypothetical protein